MYSVEYSQLRDVFLVIDGKEYHKVENSIELIFNYSLPNGNYHKQSLSIEDINAVRYCVSSSERGESIHELRDCLKSWVDHLDAIISNQSKGE